VPIHQQIDVMPKHWAPEHAAEEKVNALIHGVGFALSIPAVLFLTWLAVKENQGVWVACLLYGCSLSSMYLFSTLSHAVKTPDERLRMRLVDQGVIYTLIAGTFTPFIWGNMEGWSRIALMTAVWSAAGLGFCSKVFSKTRIDDINPLWCILLGWGPATVLFFFVSTACFLNMLLGGLLYTLGVLFLQNDHKSPHFHPIWHVMVILASASHYAGIAMFAVLQWDR
jgi:hemolysin III